jgi:hypothetical protein
MAHSSWRTRRCKCGVSSSTYWQYVHRKWEVLRSYLVYITQNHHRAALASGPYLVFNDIGSRTQQAAAVWASFAPDASVTAIKAEIAGSIGGGGAPPTSPPARCWNGLQDLPLRSPGM